VSLRGISYCWGTIGFHCSIRSGSQSGIGGGFKINQPMNVIKIHSIINRDIAVMENSLYKIKQKEKIHNDNKKEMDAFSY